MIEKIKNIITTDQLSVAGFFFKIIIILLIFFLFIVIVKENEKKEKAEKKENQFKKIYKSASDQFKTSGRYEKCRTFLLKTGADYLMGREVFPEEYYLLSTVISILIALLCYSVFGIAGAVIGALIGFKLPKMVLVLSNNMDNRQILYDMKSILDTITIKSKAGSYITDTLDSAYKFAKCKRLKTALKEMNNELITKKDIDYSLHNLQKKFSNKYIDVFCITMLQSGKSGKKNEMMQDIAEELADMEHAIEIRNKKKLEDQIELVQILIYAFVIAICMYGMIKAFGSLEIN